MADRSVEPLPEPRLRPLRRVEGEAASKWAELSAVLERHRGQRPAPLTDAEKERLLQLGVDVRAIWNASTTTSRDKKQLLRAVFEAVFVRVDRETREACVTLAWHRPATTELKVRMPRVGEHSVMDDEQVVEEIRRMAARVTDKQIEWITSYVREVQRANGIN
jgi:hypothetical protein